MRVLPVPVLQDNYAYLLIDDSTKLAAVIDPAEPEKVLRAAESENVTITAALTTHHHLDHAGGNKALILLKPNLTIYGGDQRVQSLGKLLENGDQLQVGSINVKALKTIGHTSGHVSYYCTDSKSEPPSHPVVFTGDCLFLAGCGRFFEGTPEDMYHSLVQVLGRLPSDTLVYPGHEYTVANFKFAATVEPENSILQTKAREAAEKRSQGLPTVPATIAEELSYNPFMRVGEASVQAYAKATNPIQVMGFLREAKNNFR